MNKTEQGVLVTSKLVRLCIHILWLSAFCFTLPLSAETLYPDTLPREVNAQKHHVFIIYSPGNTLHSSIIQKISNSLTLKYSDIIISAVTPEERIKTLDNNNDMIIGIGSVGMQSANKYYPETRKLFISTDPEKFRLDKGTNKNDAILYMTQSYCMQIQFIKLINDDWKVVSLLNSQKKPIDTVNIQQCGKKYGIELYIVNTSENDNMTDNIKNALDHSDVLLALPDKNIYNRSTVKNILLTSYRYRKPVIAFSKNFVNAGALASIYSNIEQVAQSASKLVEQYYESGRQFEKLENHPRSFDISINRQVFRALEITSPDINNLKQTLEMLETDNPGDSE